jgi:hypothetical protein
LYRVLVTLEKNGRKRVVQLAEKDFFRGFGPIQGKVSFGSAVEQFKLARKLALLNRTEQLGLRLPKTVRLRREQRKRPSLVLSFMKNLVPDKKYFLPGQKDQFERDLERQQEALKVHGFFAGADSFFPQLDPATGKCVAVLGDFGNIFFVDFLKKK